MTRSALQDAVRAEARRRGIDLDPEAIERLDTHFRLLQRWNKVVSLTAARDLARAAPLYTEPLQMLDQFTGVKGDPLLVDLGSGGGFPGLVLAVLLPEWKVTLVDRSARKVAFLAEAVRALGLRRTEALEIDLRHSGDLPAGLSPDRLTTKAVGQFGLTLDLLEERGTARGRAIIFTGEDGVREVERELGDRVAGLRLLERRGLAGRRRSYAVIVEKT